MRNPNQVTIWNNDRKEKSTHPDWRGQGEIGGREVWCSAWIKEDKNHQKFFSISCEDKESRETRTSFLLFKTDKEGGPNYETPKEHFEFSGDSYRCEATNKNTSAGTCCELIFIPLDGMNQEATAQQHHESQDANVPF